MDSQKVAQVGSEVQHPLRGTNPDSQLDPKAKRLLLDAHLNLVRRKLRNGVSIQEKEIRSLIPFTVPDGWQLDDTASDESDNTISVIDSSDEEWGRRVASAGALR